MNGTSGCSSRTQDWWHEGRGSGAAGAPGGARVPSPLTLYNILMAVLNPVRFPIDFPLNVQRRLVTHYPDMVGQADIETSPRPVDWMHSCFGTVLFGLIAAVLPLLALDRLYVNSPTGRPPTFGIVAVLSVGAFVGAWFMRRFLN